MKISSRWFMLFIAFVTVLACSSGKPVQQGENDSLYFSDTGFSVSGPFLKMFQSADEPLLVFGFPITDVLDHPYNPNLKVQYFQRARMDFDSSLPEGQQITLAPLGIFFYDPAKSGEDANIYTNNAACRYFEETKQSVCYLFLQFYTAHNGDKFFGLPISEVRVIDGRLVQYFERAKMEWWPENVAGRRVKLAHLGQLDFDIHGVPPPPVPGQSYETTNNKLTHVYVRVFPVKPLVGANEPQQVFIIVQDQLLNPIPGAQVMVQLEYPNGVKIGKQSIPSTKDDAVFLVENISTAGVKPNQFVKVIVDVKIGNDDPITTTTWFRVWW
jgi:hypothetical protein